MPPKPLEAMSQIHALEDQNKQLLRDMNALKQTVDNLNCKNLYKLGVLIASLGVGCISLALSIWSLLDHNKKGLNEASVAIGSVSLAVSVIGIFGDSVCSKKMPCLSKAPNNTDSPASIETQR